ncbi:putative two component transcriptional regulator, winged helix family [Kribbella flavida DSM 17836]|uniref:Putative two component transcriptional regulator, winged helix family n=1 Tax=Kribbella flavida (strain DSM 17836 / JCM 10339 / NBRC 14399) TaxID=479435 RepID=D2Q212_KRIFD|nr:winged helix-turn-helix transcriptional regulator [Kribbella flavida]ADB33958.1 putative two component transcriptional regulator, winged helix family [Kribbella flavida DSM 17836]
MVTARVSAPSDDGAIDLSSEPFPLLIAVAASVEDRVRLAELVDDVAPLLLVSNLDELRKLLIPAQDPPPVPAEQPDSAPKQGAVAAYLVAGEQGDGEVLTLDSARSAAQWRGREVPLTDLEHDLLARLMSEPVRVWTYEALHQAVWRNRHLRGTADVHSLVKRLRRKLDELGTTVTIDAVRGTGFRLADHQRPAVTGLRAG